MTGALLVAATTVVAFEASTTTAPPVAAPPPEAPEESPEVSRASMARQFLGPLFTLAWLLLAILLFRCLPRSIVVVVREGLPVLRLLRLGLLAKALGPETGHEESG